MSSYRKTMRQVREEMLVISEAKYELYHKDFSGAMQHAYKMAKKLHGITIDPKEIDDKVATGPRKPSEGDTNKYRLKGDKGGIQVQVYNKGGSKPFELNFYKEEVELDESVIDKVKEIASKKSAAKIDGVMVDSFSASAISQIYDKVNDANKKKMEKLPITKLANLAFKMMQKNDYVPEEVDLDEGTKQVLAHGGKGKYKVTKDGDTIEIKFGGKVVGTADFDRGADSFFVSIKGEKGQKSFDDAQAIADYFAKNKITEEVELDEDIATMAMAVMGLNAAALLPVLFMAVRELIRGTALESSIKKIVDQLKKNKNYKMSDSEKSDVKGFLSKVKKEKPSLLQKVMKKFKEEVDLNEASSLAQQAAIAISKKERGDKPKKEEVELDEEEDFKPHKMYDPETGEAHDAKTMEDHLRMKKMGYTHEKPKVEESAASDARRAMAADPSTKQKFSKNVSATDDDIKAADKNIMMQMRKAVSLRGNKVEFMDKKKVDIPQKVAQAVLDKYNSQKKPSDKEKFQAKVSKSYKSMLTALKERNEINNKNNSLHELRSLVREMKGKNNG